MKETILLYNLKTDKIKNTIKMICVSQGIRIRTVEPEQYGIPVGILAGGTAKQQEEYQEKSELPEAFEDEMLVFAFLTNKKLDHFLTALRKHKVPRIGLKAVLTEHNAVWNSVTLHDELCKEEKAMRAMKKSGNPEA